MGLPEDLSTYSKPHDALDMLETAREILFVLAAVAAILGAGYVAILLVLA